MKRRKESTVRTEQKPAIACRPDAGDLNRNRYFPIWLRDGGARSAPPSDEYRKIPIETAPSNAYEAASTVHAAMNPAKTAPNDGQETFRIPPCLDLNAMNAKIAKMGIKRSRYQEICSARTTGDWLGGTHA